MFLDCFDASILSFLSTFFFFLAAHAINSPRFDGFCKRLKGLFDNIDHQLLMKAVRKHTDNRWILLYIERWLTGPIQLEDGSVIARNRGVPQGAMLLT